MKSDKLKSLVAMATMAGVISMTSTIHQSNRVNKKLLMAKKVASKDSTNNINPNDLNIEISNINITKESAAGFTNNSNYIPENNIPKTTNIATSNTEVVYKIAVSLSSKTGKFYKIPKLYLTANPFAQYMGKNSNDPKEKEAAAKLLKSINVQLSELKDLNTTSTFVITAIVGVGNADWDVKVNPNFQIHAMVGNKEKVVPIKVPDILLTNHYTDNVYAGLKITHSENNKHESYLDIDLNNGNSAPNNPGIYNPANYKPQSITFKIDNPDSKDIDIIPLKVPGFTVNPDGTYTVDSRLIGQVNRLFKVVTKTNGVLNKEITVVPLNEKYNTNIDLNKTTTFNYDSASATLTQNAIGDSFTMSQGTQASGWYNIYDTFSSKLSAGVPGKYKIYSGSLLSDGNMVVIDGKNLIAIKDQTYVSLNKNAENILLTGTPSEKAAIFQRIVNGDMSGIGQAFSYDKILQMYKSGEELPQINFTYKSEEYNGNPLNMVGYYHEIPIHGAWTPMINRVFTLGILQGNYSKEEKENMGHAIEKGALSSDTIIKNNGEFSGFLLSPPDNITNQDIYDQKPVEGPVGNGTYYTTESRYGSISHDISSAITYAYEKVTTTIDSPKGAGNIVQNHPVSWLDNSHKFYFYIYGYGSGITEQYTKNTVLNVNMDAPFVLTSPVTINGVTVPKEDYKIEGNRILIRFPQRFNMSPQPRVEFEAHYITFGPQTITVSAHLEGKMGHQGIVYNYNNNPNSSELEGGATSQIVLFNSQVLTGETSNECMHYSNGVDSSGNVTLTDVIHNGKYETKKYFVVGQIPTVGSNNLPGNEGATSVGGLGSELLSLDTSGAPTWVLPKSALNSVNQDILDNTNALDLKGKLKYIESPGSGWVRYIPGKTNLSRMVAYFVAPTIEPGKDFYINYNVHLTGINRNTYQIVNSAFKYYTPDSNLGSTSNIVNLTPPGENLSYDWISKVVDLNGQAISSGALSNIINYNGEKISLNNLIGHGPDNDGKSDLTPKELQEKINLATNKEAMKELGYKLDGIYVNGQKVSKEWFNTVGILNNSTLTHIKFVISKISTDTVKVMEHSTDSNGKEVTTQVGKTTTVTGVEGANTRLNTPKIPEGYHIVNITDNGKVITNGVPSKFTGNDQNIVYNIAKTPTTTVEEHYENGTNVVPSKITANLQGTKVNTGLPELPKGYQVTKVTVNGKEVPQNEVPIIQGKDNQTIVYTIGKQPTDTVKVEEFIPGSSTPKVISSKSVTGNTGDKTGLNTPEIPKGYHIVSITNGNGDKVTGVPDTFGNSDNTTVYKIAKNVTDKVYVDVKTTTGNILTPSHVVSSGAPGSDTNVNMPEIPKDYHIVKVTVNNQVITPNANGLYNLPKTFSDNKNVEKDDKIEVIVAKNPTTTVEEHYENGTNVVPNKTTTNLQGAKVSTGLPELPSGYKVIKVTVNGKEVPQNEVPTTQSKDNQTIVYTIGKVSTDTVKVMEHSTDSNGKEVITQVGKTTTATGVEGTDTGFKTPKIPEGYHIVNITDNGKVITTGVPSKFTGNDQNIVYNIAKNPTTTVEEHYENGTNVVPSKTTTNLQGAKVNTGLPELPKGYQVTKITVNGKEVPQGEVPTTQGKDNQTIVYTIGKQPTDTVKVVYENGKPAEPSVSVTGNTGSKTGLNVPKIPEGYHIVNVTNTTKGVDGVPKAFGNTDNTTTYTIAKNVKDKTYAKVVTDINGKVVTLVPSKEVGSGKPDSKEDVITPNVPEGYKIVKVTINGKEVTPNKDGKYEVTYNSDTNKESDNNIVITVKHVPVQDTVKVVEGNKTISTTTTKPGMPGEDNGITTPNVPAGYHIGNITVDGKIVDKVPTTYGDKDQTIVYHLVENQPNDIKAKVVTEDGKTLVKDTIVAKGPEGSEVTCDKTAIPNGYHLDKVLYNGKVISTVTGGKVIYMLPDTIPSDKEGQLTYVVSPDKSSATVTVTDGTKIFSSTTTTGNVGSKITGDTPVIPKGYKIINITVNGQTISKKDLPKVYGNIPSKIVYHITKIPTGEVKQEVVTTKGTIIEEPTVVANGEVGADTNLKPYTPPKGYHIVKVIVDGKTLTTKEDKDLIHNLPSIITDKIQTVKYVIGKNVEKKGSLKYEIKINGAPYGSGELQGIPGKTASYDLPHNKYLKLESITVNGKTITTPSDVQNFENYHGKFEPNGVTIIYNYKTVITPSGSSTSNTTGAGSSTSSSTTKTTIGDNTGKDKTSTGKDRDKTTSVKPVTPEHKDNTAKPSTGDNTGKDKTSDVKPSTGKDTDKTTPVKPVSPEHKDKTTVTVNVVGGAKEPIIKVIGDVGTPITKDTPTIPKGYKVKNITVNGHTVSEKDLPKVFGKKDIHIVYHITKVSTDKTPEVKPVTPEHKDNIIKPSTGDNTGKDKTSDVKPSTGKDTDKTTPVKPVTPEHKDNTAKPSTGDNTGKDKTSDVKPSTRKDTDKTTPVKPVTPEHKDNTTKPSTGDNNGKDKTSDVKPSTGKDTDKTTAVKPVTPEHKDNTARPSTGDNTGKDKTPDVKPSTGKDTNKKTDVNHNDNKGTTGNEAHTSTSTHATVSGNGEAHSSATAHASANGGEVKTSATSNVNHNIPVVNNNGQGNIVTGNTSSARTANNTTSTNGSTETPFNSSSVNDSTGSTYTDNNLVNGPNEDNSTVQTVLPHTGLNIQGTEHTAKEAGVIAGIMAMISGLFLFRRKK
ncbi:hypothetical protein [Clostridium massiliamazoniense]|uniref:hypothetical protein n=1 Tax=Clostridium massiliamazoniense TaxID=1347366 RepID=UPI0006D7C2BA|nr:hypothetical protein [Clostridium massiliamazoniense]